MQIPSNSLFNLIHSLDASEKKYCKLYLKRNTLKKEAKIITLYNLVDKQKEFSDKALISEKAFTNEQQLFNLKKILYNNLLDALGLYYQDLNSDIQIRNYQNKAEILYYKGLTDQVHPLLDKAKKLAYKLDNYVFLRDIIAMQKGLWNKRLNTEEKYKALLHEMEHVLFINNRYETILTNANKIYGEYKKYGKLNDPNETLNELFQYIEKLRKENEKERFTKKEEVLINYQYCIYYRLLNNNSQAIKYSQKNIDLFEQHPAFKFDNYYNYINTLNIHINILCENNETEKALKYLENFKSRTTKHKLPKINRIKSDVFEFLLINELEILIESKHYKRALNTVPFYEKFINQNEEDVQEIFLPKFLIDIAIIYFMNADYHAALIWVNKILDKRYKGISNIINTANTLNILIHEKLGNKELAGHLLSNLKKLHSSNKNRLPSQIIKLMDKYVVNNSVKQPKKPSANLSETMTTEREHYMLYHFNVLDYMEQNYHPSKQ